MKFWEVKNESNDDGELILYGYIQSEKPWWSDGNYIIPDEFLKDMKRFKTKSKVTIRLNSCGGDVFAAMAIYTQLKTLTARKIVIIDGIAASAATIIAMAADEIKIPSNGLFMIHNPSVTVWDSFEVSELEKLKNMLITTKDALINAYMTRTKLSKADLATMMDEETWMTGVEAVEKGFADEVLFSQPENKTSFTNGRFLIMNSVSHDLSRFKNKPKMELPLENKAENEKIKGESAMPTEATIESLTKDYNDLVKQIEAKAKNEGILEERMRLQDIEKISSSINIELLNKARYETPMDAKSLAFENALLESAKGKQFIEDVKKDTLESGVNNVNTDPNQPPNNSKAVSDEKIKGLANIINKDKRRA